MKKLQEDTRTKLISKSKSTIKGRQRYNRRKKSRIATSVQQYNSIDMNKLFKQDILTVDILVNGETDNYTVKISFGGFLEILRDQLERSNNEINLRDILKSLTIAFNREDVYISCSCPDNFYRFSWQQTRNNINSGPKQTIPAPITNPDDNLGSGCKHILLVINNNRWLVKVASVIKNYVAYMEKHYQKAYADIIYPAIYGKEYEESVQLTIDDIADETDELVTDKETVSKANVAAKQEPLFKKGNKQGIRFASDKDELDGQLSMFDDEEEKE